MGRTTRFWDRIADRYARKPVPDEAVYRQKLETTREYLRPDMELVELGCGTGSTAIAHAPFVKHVRAIDFSARMIEIARARAAAAGVGNVTFERVSVEAIEIPDGTVDATLALSVIHLVEDRQALLERVRTMLAPGGVFVSSTACLGDTMGWFKPIAWVGRFLRLLPRVAFFTAAELEADLAGAGFRIEHRWQPGKNASLFIVARKPA